MLESKRLCLIPLTAKQLRLWYEDISTLEEELSVSYQDELPEGVFKEIVESQRQKMLLDVENWLFHTFWLIVRKSDKAVIGSIDFKYPPNQTGETEIGYGLNSRFTGNGYMTESVQTFCAWGLQNPSIKVILAETEKTNKASQLVLIKSGFIFSYVTEECYWWKFLKK